MKKFSIWLVILMMAITIIATFSFSGCKSTSTSETTAAEETTAAAEKVAPVVINFFHWKQEEKDTWDKIIKSFEDANPGITVNLEIMPEAQYYTTLQTRVMAGEGLDVFEVNPGSRFETFKRSDSFMDLSDQPFIADLNPVFLGGGQSDGKQYAIPMSKSFVGLFYNKTLFDKLNLKAPQTWDEFLNVCETIKKSGTEVIGTGLADAFTSTWPFIDMLTSNSDDLQIYPKLLAGEAKFTDPLFVDVVSPLVELAQKGYWMKNANGTKYDQSISLFATEKVAMLNNGTWAIGAIRAANPDLDFSIFIMPSPKGKLIAGVAPAQAICVFKETKNKEASLKFVNYIFGEDAMEVYGNGTGQEVPNINVVLTDKDLAAMAPIGNSGQIYAHYNSTNSKVDQDIVGELTSKAILGQDVNTILEDAQKKLEALK